MIIWFDLVFVVHISFNDIFLLSRLMNDVLIVVVVVVVLIFTCCLLVNECKVSSDYIIVGAMLLAWLRINSFLLVILY